MTTLSTTVTDSLAYAFRDFNQRTKDLSEGLTHEQFWQKPFAYGNSFGHLVLHLSGNLNHYIGTHIAGTSYVRNRELEFTDSSRYLKEETLQRLDDATEMVVKTLEQQGSEGWSAPYSVEGVEFAQDRFSMFLAAAAHFHHHVGQMIYLVKEFSTEQAS